MTKDELINRYLKGEPLTAAERADLARQLGGAHKASMAISAARTEAGRACHDWQPAQPTTGQVAYCYVKYKKVWRVLRDGEIVQAYEIENDARQHGALLADDVNAEWLGKIADPHAQKA